MGILRGVGKTIEQLLILALVMAVGVGCSSETQKNAATAGTGTPPESSSPTPAPTPDPQAKFGSNCDMNLNSNFESSVIGWLVADAELHNTGNVGEVVIVNAFWKRAGTNPLKQSKKVHLKYDHSKAVHFKVPIDQNTVDAVQSAPGYLGSGGWCHVQAKIVNTFGEAH